MLTMKDSPQTFSLYAFPFLGPVGHAAVGTKLPPELLGRTSVELLIDKELTTAGADRCDLGWCKQNGLDIEWWRIKVPSAA